MSVIRRCWTTSPRLRRSLSSRTKSNTASVASRGGLYYCPSTTPNLAKLHFSLQPATVIITSTNCVRSCLIMARILSSLSVSVGHLVGCWGHTFVHAFRIVFFWFRLLLPQTKCSFLPLVFLRMVYDKTLKVLELTRSHWHVPRVSEPIIGLVHLWRSLATAQHSNSVVFFPHMILEPSCVFRVALA
jgi:hypothetical protein